LSSAKQAAIYASVGAVNTGIDFLIFLLAVYLVGIPLAPANIVAWLGSSVSSYLLHSHVTFRETRKHTTDRKRIVSYFAVSVVGVIVGTLGVVVLALLFPPAAAKIGSIALAFAATFTLNKTLVFYR